MSNSYKDQKKSLKQPDKFQAKGIVFLDWLLKNTNKVAMVVVSVVAVFAASAGYKYFQEGRRTTRLEELGKVQVVYEAEQRQAFKQRQEISKQIDEIEKKINPAPETDPAKVAADPDPAAAAAAAAMIPKTPDPKLVAEKEALEKKMEDIKADHTGSTSQFQAFYKKFEKTPEGWMAGMTTARLLAEEKKVAEAKPILESVITLSKDSNFYQTQARLSLIGILEELSDFDGALTHVEALEKIVDNDLKPKIMLAKGRLQMLKNSKDDAKATFSALILNHGASPEAQKARSIQSLLN